MGFDSHMQSTAYEISDNDLVIQMLHGQVHEPKATHDLETTQVTSSLQVSKRSGDLRSWWRHDPEHCQGLLGYDKVAAAYVARTGVPFLAVDYRLAPEHRHPIPVNDVYAAVNWLVAHSKELGVDSSRIGIVGDSAGGGLAVAAALFARQEDGPGVARLILLSPMLDDRTVSADEHLTPFLSWNNTDNETGWQALLGCSRGREMVTETAAPGRMVDVTDMPHLYIEVGELDLFRNESIELVTKFCKSGISAELHVYPGCSHGFDIFPSKKTGVCIRAFENRDRAIKSIYPRDS